MSSNQRFDKLVKKLLFSKKSRKEAFETYKRLTGYTKGNVWKKIRGTDMSEPKDIKWPRGTTAEWNELYINAAKKKQEFIRMLSNIKSKRLGDKFDLEQPEGISLEFVINILSDPIIKKMLPDESKGYIIMKANDKYYTLSEKAINRMKENIEKLKKTLLNVQAVQDLEIEVSGASQIISIMIDQSVDSLQFRYVSKADMRKKNRRGGSFFTQLCKDKELQKEFNLTRYGIFPVDMNVEQIKKAYSENCLVEALKAHNKLSEEQLNHIRCFVRNQKINVADIKKVCEILGICIQLHVYTDEKNDQTVFIGDKNVDDSKKFEIGLIKRDKEEHYFIYENVDTTSYAFENYNLIKSAKKCGLKCKTPCRYCRGFRSITSRRPNGLFQSNKDRRTMKSPHIFKFLLDNKEKYLVPMKENEKIYLTPHYKSVRDVPTLNYAKSNYRDMEFKQNKKDTEGYKKVFFDSETTTDGNIHKAYLFCSIDTNGERIEASTAKQWMDICFTENTLAIAHNLGYDMRFLMQVEQLKVIKSIEKGKKMMRFVCNYYNQIINKNVKVVFKDSFYLISTKLSKFPDMFGLTCKKEIMPYHLYNEENVQKSEIEMDDSALSLIHTDAYSQDYTKIMNKLIDEDETVRDDLDRHDAIIQSAKDIVKEKYMEEFYELSKEYMYEKDGKLFFKHMEYAKFYCFQDCRVLMEGYNTFQKWIQEVAGLDIDDYISIPSIADSYLKKVGVYDGVCEFSGFPREFMQKFIVGGRVMTRKNLKWKVDKDLSDFDACSLYPSAMHRLPGFVIGLPKICRGVMLDYETLKKESDYFMVEVEFLIDAPKKRDFPLISIIDKKKGTRDFTNEIKGIHYLDKYSLKDVRKFHKMPKDKIKIIRGYYWNDGFNTKIKDTIKYLYETRKQKKREGNKIQEIYKLLMNSAYGKRIMKPVETEKKIFNSKFECERYVCGNNDYVMYYNQVRNSNKWMCKIRKPILNHFSSPQIGCQILTMSKRIMNEVMCLAEDMNIDIYYQDTDSMHIDNNKLDKLSEKYKKKYKRDLIGEDMGQFHSDFEVGQDKKTVPVSKQSIFLGKKCYIDRIEAQIGGKTVLRDHVRMKGIPGGCISSKVNPMSLYNNLAVGNQESFNLLDSIQGFEFSDDYTITTKKQFDRNIRFAGRLYRA